MHPTTAPATLPDTRARLERVGQAHLLRFYDTLDPSRQAALLRQIASLDIEGLPALVEGYVTGKPHPPQAASLEPAPFLAIDGRVVGATPATAPAHTWDRAAARRLGAQAIAAGRVAAFTVAGGQGSRLGFEGPKGCFPGGPVTGKPLFACLAEWILAAQRRHCPAHVTIPWYLMTSPLNHDATVAFFQLHRFFGLRQQDVVFFPQGVLPSFDMATGRVLLAAPDEVAVNPDGHGGSLRALHASGATADMRRRGVDLISYTQIDNPLVRVIDPVFLGVHLGSAAQDPALPGGSSGEMSSKMVAKAGPAEKVGVLCHADGRTAVIEYSDLPKHLAERTNPDGSLAFAAGSIAVHVIAVDFVERLNGAAGARQAPLGHAPGHSLAAQPAGLALPLHRAEKKVPYTDPDTGRRVEPTTNNAVKLETFVFDALPLAARSVVLETARAEEFAPIKNAAGPDSPESCALIQTARAARWLEAAGVGVPRRSDGSPDCVIELSPLTALEPQDVPAIAPTPRIAPGLRVAL
ncbi:MAG: hypothetical protein C0475_05035 [Planctomyces sp.]|nr:hypothetical protein [Planctomyces sp.]